MLHPPFRTFNFTPSLPTPLPIPSHGTGGGLEGENGAVFCTWQSLSAAAPHTFSLLQGGLLRKQIYSTIVCSMSCGKISSLWSTSSLSFLSDMLFLAFPPASACPWSFSSVLKTPSQGHHYLGPTVSLLQPAGIGSVQHRAAPAFSHRGYLCSTTPFQYQNLALAS